MARGQMGQIKQDLNGATELRTVAVDFVNLLATGDSLLSSPAPVVEQLAETTGASALTPGTPSLNGTQVLFTLTGGTAGALYDMSCTVHTTQGNVLVASWGITVIASR